VLAFLNFGGGFWKRQHIDYKAGSPFKSWHIDFKAGTAFGKPAQ
jgi:hypothetical protein